MPDLKPCPFCGGKAELHRGPSPAAALVECCGCDAVLEELPEFWGYDSAATAMAVVQRWNMRYVPPEETP